MKHLTKKCLMGATMVASLATVTGVCTYVATQNNNTTLTYNLNSETKDVTANNETAINKVKETQIIENKGLDDSIIWALIATGSMIVIGTIALILCRVLIKRNMTKHREVILRSNKF